MEASSTNFSNALDQAVETKRLELTNQHALNRLKAELGLFGKVFGNGSHAPVMVAFLVIVLGFGAAIGLWITAAYHPAASSFWSSEAHLALAAATSALAYIFGRGSKDGGK